MRSGGIEGLRDRGMHDRHEIDGHDEQRPAHAERADEGPVVVERLLDSFDIGPLQAGGGGEDDGRGVRRVEADHLLGERHDIGGLGLWRG